MNIRYFMLDPNLYGFIGEALKNNSMSSEFNKKVGIFSDNRDPNNTVKIASVFDIDDCLYLDQELQKKEAILRELFREKIENKYGKIDWKVKVAKHGSTKLHLHREFGVSFKEIQEEYEENDFSGYEGLKPDIELRDLILSLPGPKICFTNGYKERAEKILKQLNLEDCFLCVFCCGTDDKAEYVLKPNQEAYKLVEEVLKHEKIITEFTEIYFFDDRLQNIIAAEKQNWITYHVTSISPIKRCIGNHLEYIKKFYPSPDTEDYASRIQSRTPVAARQ